MTPIDRALLATRRPVFIVSTGRAGSQMIAHALRAHPGICALHEPAPQMYVEAYARWSGSGKRARVLERVRRKRASLITQVTENGLHYVESSHFCAHLIPELRELFDARFVHLHRDVESFVQSALTKGWYEPGEGGALGERLRAVVRRRLMVDLGNPGVDHRLSPPRGLSRAEKIAWLWSQMNGAILRDLETVPAADQMTIALADAGPARLAELVRFIGADADEATVARMGAISEARPNRSAAKAERPSFPERDRAAALDLTRGMRQRLGYPA